MEVLLKRSKITKSIFNQISELNFLAISKFKVLGYVKVMEEGTLHSYIVYYHSESNTLAKSWRITHVSQVQIDGQFQVKIDLAPNSNWNKQQKYNFGTVGLANEFEASVNQAMREAYDKGQFYL